ncbi:L-threonine dehydratase catabolic TdcB [bioreactor metagenome]|uniref:L-threonine dehydratase catabolic TdcB n=1 Tax=bioreactor metagenome TaxID=1076179 RepID=A0A644VLX5_9ZZZZ|nr:threonine/serine dehydratase [Acidaminococcaceae bacterium]
MLTINEVKEAQKRLAPYVYKTPLIRLRNLDSYLNCKVYVKAECMQLTNSFKIRGALNKVLQLTPEELKNGIVTASSGNHGRGVAYAAKMLGVKATVVIPDHAPKVKQEAIKALGAEVILCDKAKRFDIAESISKEQQCCYIHPFNDYDVMAGQGTAALEILEELPEADAILTPIGGGGLISGIATGAKGVKPNIKIYGCEPAQFPRYTVSLAAGKVIKIPMGDSIADGIQSLAPEDKTFPIVQALVDRVFAVDEEYIYKGMKLLLNYGKVLAEPSSSISMGAVMQGLCRFKPEDKVVFLLSGGNVDLSLISKLDKIKL